MTRGGAQLRAGAPRWSSVAIVLVMIVGGLGIGLLSPHAVAAIPPGTGPAAHPQSFATPSPPPPPGSPNRGTFLTTTPIPDPSVGEQSCLAGWCVNASNDPSINRTSTGLLAVAYTAYTNQSPCLLPQTENTSLVEIGFVTSSNDGANWSSPEYLGNPDCSTPNVTEYPNAWEPSLTSLANGTLVLAYIEFNVTTTELLPVEGFSSGQWNVPYDRLVVTESYDNGAVWSTPTVLNSSADPSLNGSAFAPMRPWVDASGSTVYVTWMNLTTVLGAGTGSSAVHLLVSTDGGVSWGASIDLPTVESQGNSIALNPTVTVLPNGLVLVAYVTNVTFESSYDCTSGGCLTDVWIADVVVLSSINNGTTFTAPVSAASGVLLGPPIDLETQGEFFSPSPQFAYSPLDGELYLTYSAGAALTECFSGSCYADFAPHHVFLVSSNTSGATWTTPTEPTPQLDGYGDFGPNMLYNPAIAVSPSGTVNLAFSYDNYSVCGEGFFGQFCGPQYQVFTTSTDDGATFAPPVLVTDNATQLLDDPNNPDGEYATMVAAGSSVWSAWTIDECAGWNQSNVYSNCTWPGAGGVSQIEVSEPYTGTGLTLTFTETGLPAGTSWSANVLGNLRQASAPTNLVVSGIPSGENLLWNVTNVAPYGIRYFATPTPAPPYTITTSTTVTYAYAQQYLVNLTTVPYLPSQPNYGFCEPGYPAFTWDFPICPTVNWNITPVPGDQWVDSGGSLAVSTSPVTSIYCTGTCYGTDYLNVTFLSWTGTGAGSINTTANSTTLVVNGPINETANYQINGWCYYYTGATQCEASNASLGFHESGLPAGTQWGVTLSSDGNVQVNQSSTPWIAATGLATTGLVDYVPWTVPDPATGEVWIPTSTPPSPVELPGDRVVQINYTLGAPDTASFPAYALPSGLFNGTPWSYSIDGVSYGVENGSSSEFELTGGTHTLTAGPAVLANGTRFVASGTSVDAYVENGSWQNSTVVPSTVSIDGPSFLYFNYTPQYRVTVTNSLGGTATPLSQWVAPGAAVDLMAVPSPGDHFVAWTGSGSGSGSGTTEALTVHPEGPIRELATFAPNGLPLWNVTVQQSSLPSRTSYEVTLGNQTYSGTGPSFVIPGILGGTYGVELPYVAANGTNGTRYLGSVQSTSFALGNGSSLVIGASGTLNLTFAAQYLLTVSSSGNGTVSPTPGTSWVDAGAIEMLQATPDPGNQVVGWTGLGAAAVTSSDASITVTVTSPVLENVQFGAIPTVAPLTYALAITETGLPAGTLWSASLPGGTGVSSTSSTISVSGLNGTYLVEIPIVGGTAGVRYVPGTANNSEPVTGPGASLAVVFTTEFLLSVTSSIGGSVSPSGSWVDNGSSVSLTATASTGNEFEYWNGTGTGSYTGTATSTTLLISGPISEVATFEPVPTPVVPAAAPSNDNGLPIALGLLLALLVVGLVMGVLIFRRSPSPPTQSWDGPEGTASLTPEATEPPTSGTAAEEPAVDEFGATMPEK
ncbi:MAG: hypothetical protein L3K03_06155 [Thermoplasmata archaeon]|nr:hypothetical protein [Thermoplasmata archaeon]